MQDFLTVAATATELAAIALLFTSFVHAWTRTAPAPVATVPTPAAVEPVIVAAALPVEPIIEQPIALDTPATPVKRQSTVSTVKEVKAQPKTKRRSIRKVA